MAGISTRARKIVKKEKHYEILKPNDFDERSFYPAGRSYSLRGLFNFLKDYKDNYDFYTDKELANDEDFKRVIEKINGLEVVIVN